MTFNKSILLSLAITTNYTVAAVPAERSSFEMGRKGRNAKSGKSGKGSAKSETMMKAIVDAEFNTTSGDASWIQAKVRSSKSIRDWEILVMVQQLARNQNSSDQIAYSVEIVYYTTDYQAPKKNINGTNPPSVYIGGYNGNPCGYCRRCTLIPTMIS